MILFVVPVGMALANRPKQPLGPYRHLSTWRLVLCELAHLSRRRTHTWS